MFCKWADGGSGLRRAETLKVSPDFFGGFEAGDVATLLGDGVVDDRGGLDASRSSSSPTSSTSTSTSSSSTSTSTSPSRRSDGGESGQGECDGDGLLVAGDPTRRPTPKDSRSGMKILFDTFLIPFKSNFYRRVTRIPSHVYSWNIRRTMQGNLGKTRTTVKFGFPKKLME